METRTNPLRWPAWAWWGLVTLALTMAAFTVAGAVSNVARSAGLLHDLGDHGMKLEQPAGTPFGWSRITAVIPEGAAAKAGLIPGDVVRYEGLFGYSVGYGPPPTRPAEPAEITIERDGTRFHRSLPYPPGPPFPGTEPLVALNALTALVITVFGAILLIRGRRDHRAVMLGVIMLYIAISATRLPTWSPNITVAQARVITTILSMAAMGWLWPHFCLEISGGAATHRQARWVRAGAVVLVALGVSAAIVSRLPVTPSIDRAAWAGWLIFVGAGWLFGFAIIGGNYRRNDSAARNRIQIVIVAFVCYLLAQALNQSVTFLLAAGYAPIQGFWLGMGAASLSLIGLGVLVYAVLSHKLFDIGFVLNRTLVYGVVSSILLAAFGLAEWSIEHLVPESWHEGGALFSAGIALALFLSFHRLRDWVERHVERLLFSTWHRNEATLRRFIGATDHFGSIAALLKAFAGELSRFAGGADAAVYLRDPNGGFRLSAGKLTKAGRHIADDDRGLALMRAERRPVGIARAHASLPGVLALPMLDQGALLGFALMGRKRDGSAYRPDEIELLGWATQQVGFAAQAQHVRELEATISELRAQVSALSGRSRPRAVG